MPPPHGGALRSAGEREFPHGVRQPPKLGRVQLVSGRQSKPDPGEHRSADHDRSRARLGCHEGYPGHHVQGIYNERLYRERGWVEYSVVPLFQPVRSAERRRRQLRRGAGVSRRGADRFRARRAVPACGSRSRERARLLRSSQRARANSRARASRSSPAYLDGDIDRERAIELLAALRTQHARPRRAKSASSPITIALT